MITSENPANQGATPDKAAPREDAELLRRYVADRSEEAFAELVRRHLPPVYGFALRRVGGDVQLAEDVAQIVFTALARKATALAGRPVLGGWLCRATHFAARDVVRAEQRRRAREQEARLMNESATGPGAAIDWEKLRPLLDRTIGELSDDDRDAVWLRFFEGRSLAEVGARLRVTENAARMRVERALDKLHAALGRQGVNSTAAALGLVLANQAFATAPASVVASLTGAALANAASGSAGAWLAFFTMSKIKVGIVSTLFLAAVATSVVELRAHRELRAEVDALQTSRGELTQLRQESLQWHTEREKRVANNPEADEVARLRQRLAALKVVPAGAVKPSMKPAAMWRNVGHATPAAALETGLWASSVGDLDGFSQGYFLPAEMKAGMEKIFADQSAAVRARYGTPERFLAGIWLAMGRQRLPIAFQILDESPAAASEPDSVILRVGIRDPSGQEEVTSMKFQHGPAGWGLRPPIIYTEAEWTKLASRIDQSTGEYRAPESNSARALTR